MEMRKCEGCKLEFPKYEIKELGENNDSPHFFCEFCGGSFISNSIIYPNTNVTRRQILQTIARSHNIIMKEIKNIKLKTKGGYAI